MAIASETARAQYTLSGSGQTLSVPFYFLANADLLVTKTVAGVDTTLVLTTDYTVTGAGNTGGGSITLVAGTSGEVVTISRGVALTQDTTLTYLGQASAAAFERGYDRLAMQVQKLGTQMARVLRLPVSSAAVDEMGLAARTGKTMQFNATTGALELTDSADSSATAAAASAAAAAASKNSAGASEVAAAASAAAAAAYQAKIEVGTVAGLKGLSVASFSDGDVAVVRGYFAGNDSGGGLFYRDAASATADNGGTILAPNTGTGRWRRIHGDMVDVRWFGAKGDGTTDDTAAIQAAAAYVRTASGIASVAGGDPVSRLGLYFSAGTYLVTTSEALLPGTYTTKTRGLKIKGAGRGQTLIWFKPTAGTRYLMNGANSYLVNDIEDITFISDSTSNTFLYSVSNTGGCQRWNFSRCEWSGVWGKGMHLTGGNNNSEWTFFDCGVSGEMTDFLYTPASGASDQFLNFWFDHMKFWPTESARSNCWINLNLGGSVKITNSDISGYQNGTLFKLLGATHASGVCSFVSTGNRFEMKSTNTKVLETQWGQGNITFRDCDFSSQASAIDKATVMFSVADVNSLGSALLFESCSLIGTIQFNHGTDDFRHRKVTTFLNCEHPQFSDFFDCLSFSSSTNDGGHRQILVKNCRGGGVGLSFYTGWATSTAYTVGTQVRNGLSVYEVTTAGTSASSGGPKGHGSAITDGTVVWKWLRNDSRDYATDALVGAHQRANPVGIQKHIVSFRNAAGALPNLGGTQEIILPPNVIITSARIYAPSGAVTSGAIADYKIQTMESTPTVFAQVSVTPASGGFDNTWNGFFTTGTDILKRSVQLVVGASTDQVNYGGFAILEYIG